MNCRTNKLKLFFIIALFSLSFGIYSASEKGEVCQLPAKKYTELRNIKSLKGQIEFWDEHILPAIEKALSEGCFDTHDEDSYRSFDGAEYKNMYIDFVTRCIYSHNAQKRFGADHSKFIKKLIDRNVELYASFLEEFKSLSEEDNESSDRFAKFLKQIEEFEEKPIVSVEKPEPKEQEPPAPAEEAPSKLHTKSMATVSDIGAKIKDLQEGVDKLLEGL